MPDPVEDRLAHLAAPDAPAAQPAPDAFIAAVARTRRRRKLVINASAWTIAAAPIVIWMSFFSAPTNSTPRPDPDHTTAHRDRENTGIQPNPASAWTLAALSRRIDNSDLDADSLIPGRWSMGWTARPPL